MDDAADNELVQGFLRLDWHDAALLEVRVDRSDPHNDQVAMLIEWPDSRRQVVRFTGCYLFVASMNFGIVAPETVRSAECSTDHPQIAKVQGTWQRTGTRLPDLAYFSIETNSTGSLLELVARRFELEDLADSANPWPGQRP